jgi:hypothetical protein
MSEDFKCQADDTAKGDAVSANASSIERGAEAESHDVFLRRMEAIVYHETDSGNSMVDTDDLQRLVETAKRLIVLSPEAWGQLTADLGDDPPLQAQHQPDIEKAREVWLAIYETSTVMIHPDDAERYVSIIATALRAEREAAAKFVENWPHVHPNVSSSIAKAIRKGDTHV